MRPREERRPARSGSIPPHVQRRLAYLALTLTALFWAGNAIVARGLHQQISPVSLAFARWALASLLVLPFAWPVLRRDLPALRAAWLPVLILALLGISSFNTLLYQAAHTTSATNIALVQSTMPAAIVALGFALYGQRPSARGALAVAVTMLGAAVVISRGDPGLVAAREWVAGDLWMLGAVVVYALYSVLLRTRPRVHGLSFVAATFILGTLLLAPLAVLDWHARGLPTPSPEVLGGIAYVGVFPSIVAYLFWNHGVATVGPERAGLFICLIPLFTSALAAVFLDEALQDYHVLGLALILTGFVLFERAERHRRPPGR